jgi:hypothetical protein
MLIFTFICLDNERAKKGGGLEEQYYIVKIDCRVYNNQNCTV